MVALFVFSVTGCMKHLDDQNKKITVVFRFDDPSALSSLDTELKVIESFREVNASLTFGIIPFKCKDTRDPLTQELTPLSKEKADVFRQAVKDGTLDLALHGYSHQMSAVNSWTEFSGVSYGEQHERLTKGKEYLETLMGVPLHTFIPPYNTYDLNTVKVLENLGFTILSAGMHGAVSGESKLAYIPMSIRLHQLKQAIEEARRSLDSEPIIVVMFHEYDFLDISVVGIQKRLITIPDLKALLFWLRKQNDVQIVSLTEANKQIKNLNAQRFEYIKMYHSLHNIIPGFLKKSNSIYPEESSLFFTFLKTLILYSIIFLIGFMITSKMSCRILDTFLNVKYRKIIISVFLSLIIILPMIYIFSSMSIHTKIVSIYLFLIGTTAGLTFCPKKKDHMSF